MLHSKIWHGGQKHPRHECGKRKKRPKDGGGGFSNSRAVVTWCVANAVPERGGKRMNPDTANKNRTCYKERNIYENTRES